MFGAVLGTRVLYVPLRLGADLSHARNTPAFEFALLRIALAIALGFESVNGFHDTANRRDSHLHAQSGTACRGRMVGVVKSDRRAYIERPPSLSASSRCFPSS